MGKLSELNTANVDRAIALITPLIERAPSIAKRVVRRRPFGSAEDVSQAIRIELLGLKEAERIELFNAHPELAPDNPLAMTSESQSEQGRLDITSNDNEYRERLGDLNARYREKHGFPFITALVRHQDIDSVLVEFEARLMSDREAEIEQAIEQIALVSSARVQSSFGFGDTCSLEAATAKT
ncbi:MAG: 2-oxo-4-hydroxy-4-carboxy-5-ureidoimidazoline decarboxylase [Rhizobiaceae bacterium]